MLSVRCARFYSSLLQNFQKLSVTPKPVFITREYQREFSVVDNEEHETKAVIEKVNNEIQNKTYGRLFAVVQLCGKQFKITDEDLIVVDGLWPPTVGDKIRLEKVLLVGSANFTLVGRPLLPQDQVSVYATVIEKTLTPTIVSFKKIRAKRFKRTRLSRLEETFIRINSINLDVGVNEIGDVDGLKDRVFQC